MMTMGVGCVGPPEFLNCTDCALLFYFILFYFFGSTLPRAGRVPRPFLTTHRHQRFIFISFDNQQKSTRILAGSITTQPGAQQRCCLNQQGPYTTDNIIICSQLAQKITLPKIKLFNCFHFFFV
jgi:hypothetical protein